MRRLRRIAGARVDRRPGDHEELRADRRDPDAPDPKAPKRVWVHWVRSQIPATTTSFADSRGAANPGTDGKNDWGTPGWRGPCPPIGRHRYVFSVYALDADLGAAGMTKAELVKAIAGHVVAAGRLVGTYQKQK